MRDEPDCCYIMVLNFCQGIKEAFILVEVLGSGFLFLDIFFKTKPVTNHESRSDPTSRGGGGFHEAARRQCATPLCASVPARLPFSCHSFSPFAEWERRMTAETDLLTDELKMLQRSLANGCMNDRSNNIIFANFTAECGRENSFPPDSCVKKKHESLHKVKYML